MTGIPLLKFVEYCSWTYPHHIYGLSLLCRHKSPILIENEWVPVSLVLSLSLSDGSHLVCCYCHGQLWNIPFFLCSQCAFFTKIQKWSIHGFWGSIQPVNWYNCSHFIILFSSHLSCCLHPLFSCFSFFPPHCSGLLIKHRHHGTHFFPSSHSNTGRKLSQQDSYWAGTHRKREERTENNIFEIEVNPAMHLNWRFLLMDNIKLRICLNTSLVSVLFIQDKQTNYNNSSIKP